MYTIKLYTLTVGGGVIADGDGKTLGLLRGKSHKRQQNWAVNDRQTNRKTDAGICTFRAKLDSVDFSPFLHVEFT